MFERFFNSPKNPEDAERRIQGIVSKELSEGVDGNSVRRSFKMAKNINSSFKSGLTNNHILNIVRNIAVASIGPMERMMYGGADNAINNIDMEINSLRKSLTDEEKIG